MVIQTRHPLQMELGARWSALPETVFARLYDPLSVGGHMNMCGRAGYRLDRLEGRAKGPYVVLEGCMVSKSIGGGLLGSLPAKPFTIWFDKAMLRAAEVSAKPEPEGNATSQGGIR